MLCSYTVITHNRASDLEATLASILHQDYEPFEIVVVDNASSDDTSRRVDRIRRSVPCRLRYRRLPENLGVSGGRNVAMSEAQGGVVITLDDDAVFADSGAARRAMGFLEEHPDIGILAFKLVDYHTGAVIPSQYPTREKWRDPDVGFETTWFIGAGHAIRKEVFDKVGMYGNYAPYGSEEFDFSLRALDAGVRIWYLPSVEVQHKQSTQGRVRDQTMLNAIKLHHRMKAAVLNLPWPNVITYLVVWSGAFFVRFAPLNLRVITLAHWWLLGDLRALVKDRRPVKPTTMRRMRTLKGQLWY